NYQPAPGANWPGAATLNEYNQGSVTNMFVWTNRFHDYMYDLGFTEAAGNFQVSNFNRGGEQQDPVFAEAQDTYRNVSPDPVEINNANFTTFPDGLPGKMQMYVFEGLSDLRDSALDNSIVIHELAHGLSNRLIGNAAGLVNLQGRGMGEGWSDFAALSMLSDFPAGRDQNPHGIFPLGSYVLRENAGIIYDHMFYGIRRFPYSTNPLVSPLTFQDMDNDQYSAL